MGEWLKYYRHINSGRILRFNEYRMNLGKYPCETTDDFLEYEFNSIGPKGTIKKVIRYTLLYTADNRLIYNLGFGDWNEEKGAVDDFVISNNEDKDKILATVARTAVSVMNHYPGIAIYAAGSTPSRTRLYQIGLNKYIDEIGELFFVYGLAINDEWQPFVSGVNYNAFVIFRK